MAINTIEFLKLVQNKETSYFFKPPYKRHYLPYMNEIVSITYLNYSVFTFQTTGSETPGLAPSPRSDLTGIAGKRVA